jgi:nicotinate-nucleotide adenylyltransferase
VGQRGDLRVSDLELQRPGPSYTIDTVHHLRALLPAKSDLYLMVGLDAFLEIATWRRYRDLLQEVPVIVMSRPSTEAARGAPAWKKLEDYLQSSISNVYRFDPLHNGFTHPQWQPIHPLEVTPVPISSTGIRDRIRCQKPIGSLVPQAVADYIERKGLYR